MIPVVIGARGLTQRFGKRTGKGRNQISNSSRQEHRDNSIIKIGYNTENSTINLKRHAVTETPVKDHQLTLMEKRLKE